MTKHIFEAFARRIKADREGLADVQFVSEADRRQAVYAMNYAAIVFADIAQANNPRFDRERFMQACGLSEPRKAAPVGGKITW